MPTIDLIMSIAFSLFAASSVAGKPTTLRIAFTCAALPEGRLVK
jgi:hypothetical protein